MTINLDIVFLVLQKPANILVMGEGPERGRVKIGEIPTPDRRQLKTQHSENADKKPLMHLSIDICGLKFGRNSIFDRKLSQISNNLQSEPLFLVVLISFL